MYHRSNRVLQNVMLLRKVYGLALIVCLLDSDIIRTVRCQEGSGTTDANFADCSEGYPEVANAAAFTGATTHGSVLDVNCNNLYVNSGSTQFTCNNGEWLPVGDGGTPMCLRFCGNVEIADGTATFPDNGCKYLGCTVNFACNAGYLRNGASQLTCQESGAWGVHPTCEIRDCGAPTLANGAFSGATTTFGSTVTFSCSSSYLLAGSSTATCTQDGTWTELPTCVYDCGEFPTIPDANVAALCPGQQIVGCTVTVTCPSGYNLVGNEVVECFEDQGWDYRPNCQLIVNGQTYDISVIIPIGTVDDRAAFTVAIEVALNNFYRRTVGSAFRGVVIRNIQYFSSSGRRRKRQTVNADRAQVDYSVLLDDADVTAGSFSKAQTDLVTTESLNINGQETEPLQTTLLGATFNRAGRDSDSVTDVSCQIYFLQRGVCESGTECKVSFDGNTTSCQPIKEDDDIAVKIGLGVGIPLFLLTCALIIAVCCYIHVARKRSRRRLRKHHELDDSDSATMSGFAPVKIPTRFNPGPRRGPFYSSYFPEAWNEAASLDSDDDAYLRRDRRETRPPSYLVSVGYSDPKRLDSNFSWDFMYPHMDQDYSMPRPRI